MSPYFWLSFCCVQYIDLSLLHIVVAAQPLVSHCKHILGQIHTLCPHLWILFHQQQSIFKAVVWALSHLHYGVVQLTSEGKEHTYHFQMKLVGINNPWLVIAKLTNAIVTSNTICLSEFTKQLTNLKDDVTSYGSNQILQTISQFLHDFQAISSKRGYIPVCIHVEAL